MSEPRPIEAGQEIRTRHDARPASPCGSAICHVDTLTPALAMELDMLYQHFNSSLRHFALRVRAQGASAYVARRDGQPLAIFLFHREKTSIRVLNEMIGIPAEELERFAAYAFARFPAVSAISFSLIGKDIGALSFPFQQYGQSEDIVVTLPSSPDAYLASLGSKTRHNIRHQLKAIVRDYPGLQFRTLEHEAIGRQDVLDLIALKRRNTDEKGIGFGISAEEADWLAEQARECGLLVVAMADGRLCGGSLSLRLGDHYFAYVVAYDTTFASYSLGMLCCYLAMQEKIARRASMAHLSWGRQQYKFKLQGVQQDMACLDIYRSRMAYWRHPHRLLRHAARDGAQRCKRALLDSERRQGVVPALSRALVGTVRAVKRLLVRRRQRPERHGGKSP